jgi:methyltransferase (TIGR00027 family)
MQADKPSSTAALIAAATVLAGRDVRLAPFVAPEASEACERWLRAAASLRCRALLALARSPLGFLPRLAERMTIPGLLLHFMLRKRWIEERLRASLQRGCRQIVVIAAGFDSLAWRLARDFPAARFFEVDHPATQAAKRRAGGESRLRLVAADLESARLHQLLPASGFRDDQSSCFVVEGLLMYLAPDETRTLLRSIARLQRDAGEVLFTVMEPGPGGRLSFHNATRLATAVLALWREPFRSSLRREELATFLAPLGLVPVELADAARLRERYLAGHGTPALAVGELAVLAKRSRP